MNTFTTENCANILKKHAKNLLIKLFCLKLPLSSISKYVKKITYESNGSIFTHFLEFIMLSILFPYNIININVNKLCFHNIINIISIFPQLYFSADVHLLHQHFNHRSITKKNNFTATQ